MFYFLVCHVVLLPALISFPCVFGPRSPPLFVSFPSVFLLSCVQLVVTPCVFKSSSSPLSLSVHQFCFRFTLPLVLRCGFSVSLRLCLVLPPLVFVSSVACFLNFGFFFLDYIWFKPACLTVSYVWVPFFANPNSYSVFHYKSEVRISKKKRTSLLSVMILLSYFYIFLDSKCVYIFFCCTK